MKKQIDPLLKTVEDIRAYAEDKGLAIFYGWAYDEQAIHWNEEQGGDWLKFLEAAATLGAKCLYLNWAPLEQFQIDEALERTTRQGPRLPHSGPDEIRDQRRRLEKFLAKVGQTAAIDLAFSIDGTLHSHQISADWFDELNELREEGEEAEQGRRIEVIDKAVVDQWARELARHPQFGGCKTYDQREYLLEALSKDEFGDLPHAHILRRAEVVYVFEVRPKEEERLRDEARRLRKQGLSISAIAQKLGISRERAGGLVTE